ncbi:DUF3267 domain-containing protein [Clostridium sp. Marseille-P2415]|uniref:DUF3267 domain-containing protein n=1 Tax=Clostridium sp. Marseille-P2415 TaxID=1805471 RepID=UPI0009885844|nr:DUF3267 domain-containing protein [Clostridium sp. Marseille-P2415]
MKFIRKIPQEDCGRTKQLSEDGWIKLKEPKTVEAAILWALPLSVLLMLLSCIWCYFLYPSFQALVKGETEFMIEFSIGFKSLLYVAGVIAFLLVHELIHALFIPNVWRSDQTFWGFNGVFGFVYTQEMISKGRFLLISVMPLVVLSFIFPFIMSAAGRMNGYIMFLSVLNAGGACVDFLNIILVSIQVPGSGKIVSNGLVTFYQ